MTITLTREEAQQVLNALSAVWKMDRSTSHDKAMETLRTKLTQPEREWQGLTDEEIGMLTVFDGLHHVEVPLLANFVRAIEAKLREKNS